MGERICLYVDGCRSIKVPFQDIIIKKARYNDRRIPVPERKICPVEVKSGTYRKHSSLGKFRSKFSGKIGQAYILYTKDILVREEVAHLPLYMAMFL